MMGWLRIMRRGSVIGAQQHFLCTIEHLLNQQPSSVALCRGFLRRTPAPPPPAPPVTRPSPRAPQGAAAESAAASHRQAPAAFSPRRRSAPAAAPVAQSLQAAL